MTITESGIIVLDKFEEIQEDDGAKVGNFAPIYSSLESISKSSHDHVVKMGDIAFMSETYVLDEHKSDRIRIRAGDDGPNYYLSDWALSQLCGRFRIPMSYAKHCLENKRGHLLTHNIYAWALGTPNKETLVRTTGGICHGILSDRYTIFDDFEYVNMIKPLLESAGDFLVKNYTASPEMFKARIVTRETFKIGSETYSLGFDFSNSRVGKSSVHLKTVLFKWKCMNGLVVPGQIIHSLQKKHFGISAEGIGEAIQVATSMLPQVQSDIVSMSEKLTAKRVSAEELETLVNKMRVSVLNSAKLAEKVVANFHEAGDATYMGFIDAITHSAKDYSLSTRERLESFAGNLLIA